VRWSAAADPGVVSRERRNSSANDPRVLGEAGMELEWSGNARRLNQCSAETQRTRNI
jgi:hypothetical protein